MLNLGSEKVANLLPNTLIRTRERSSAPTLYLTFDDGPHPTITSRLCEALRRHNVSASFFCIGRNLITHPEIAEELLANGHAIYNHSNAHRNYPTLTQQGQLEDINACQSLISRHSPKVKKVFRAPQGKLSLMSLLLLKRHGWQVVHWSYDSLDYKKPTTSELVTQLRNKQVKRGDILLFHDDDELCIHALDVMIPEWKNQGFNFSTLEHLLR